MASGRPFIASDVDGLHEMVNGAGVLFPDGDHVALASAIRSLCENPEKYKAVAARCQARAKDYDISKWQQAIMPFIKKSLMNKKKLIRVTTVAQSIGFYRDLIPQLQQDYEVIGVSSPGAELQRLSEEMGVQTIEVPMERHISIIHDLKSLWKMVKVFREERPEIVHSMTPKAGLITMMAGWLCGVPVRVHTFTGLVWPTAAGLKRRILMATDWLTCACATHIIPEGQGVLNDLKMAVSPKSR